MINNIVLAISSLEPGGAMIIDDGTYDTTFDIPPNIVGYTIRSASGDAYKYTFYIINHSLYYEIFLFVY